MSLQALVDQIRERGATVDAKTVDDAFRDLALAVFRIGKRDLGDLEFTPRQIASEKLTYRNVLAAIAESVKEIRKPIAQDAAQDRAVAELQKHLG